MYTSYARSALETCSWLRLRERRDCIFVSLGHGKLKLTLPWVAGGTLSAAKRPKNFGTFCICFQIFTIENWIEMTLRDDKCIYNYLKNLFGHAILKPLISWVNIFPFTIYIPPKVEWFQFSRTVTQGDFNLVAVATQGRSDFNSVGNPRLIGFQFILQPKVDWISV